MSNASKKCKRVNDEKAEFLGELLLKWHMHKNILIYACTSIYFNLIPQRSAQEYLPELHFKAEFPNDLGSGFQLTVFQTLSAIGSPRYRNLS